MNDLNIHVLFIRKTICKKHTQCFAITSQNSLHKNQHAKNQCLNKVIQTHRETPLIKLISHFICKKTQYSLNGTYIKVHHL